MDRVNQASGRRGAPRGIGSLAKKMVLAAALVSTAVAAQASASFVDTMKDTLMRRSSAEPEVAVPAVAENGDSAQGNVSFAHSPYRRYKRGPTRNWGVSVGGASDVPVSLAIMGRQHRSGAR